MINALGHQEKIRKKDVLNERPPHGAYKYRRQNVGMKKYAERKKGHSSLWSTHIT